MRIPICSILLLPLVVSSCSRHSSDSAAPPAPVVAVAPIIVATRPADEQPMPRYLRVTGELEGFQQALVAADASGKVVAAPIERGSVVKAGDVLLRLDDRSAALSLAEAEATLVSAQLKLDLQRTELARNEPLAKTHAISDTDYQRFKIDFASAEAAFDASQAKRDMAKKSLADTTVLAPFDGTVAERLVQVGEYLGANSQVANLVATDRLRLVLSVPETSIGSIRPGQPVSFKVPAFPDAAFTGIVKFIGAAVRNASRDLIVEAEVANQDGRLKPGMFAEGRLSLAEQKSVTVPTAAVRTDGTVRKVFVLVGDHLEERLVEVGETRGDLIEIRRGVIKGEPVVAAPGAEATDGIKARATTSL